MSAVEASLGQTPEAEAAHTQLWPVTSLNGTTVRGIRGMPGWHLLPLPMDTNMASSSMVAVGLNSQGQHVATSAVGPKRRTHHTRPSRPIGERVKSMHHTGFGHTQA